ncbi:MAG: prepilin-type N-terminal cleavage/methylation domain-containing protein [Candidatus Riflebacteria bacterium]|nr:prepilin-type N-terminal cleavage/methylation domain-containing protein [Candidatus Riflebacteria bacterium]
MAKNCKILKKMCSQAKAFTLIEILVAAVVFTLFLIGVFSMFQMGNQMFVGGSWKLEKQKHAQRFLTVLKERLERATNLSKINPLAAPDSQISTSPASVYTLNSGSSFNSGGRGLTPNASSTSNILLFSACMPDLTSISATKPGMCIAHSVTLIPDAVDNLYSLRLIASKWDTWSTNANAANGIGSAIGAFPPNAGAFGDFSGTSEQYQLGEDPFSITIDSVKRIVVEWAVASGTGSESAGKVLGIRLDLMHPKFPQTQITQEIRSKIAYDVAIVGKAPGGL